MGQAVESRFLFKGPLSYQIVCAHESIVEA